MIDERDMHIIDALRRDARTPYTEIAKKLEISEATVRNRVRTLERKGVIRKFTVLLDPAKLGYQTVALVGADVDPDRLLGAARRLSKIEHVKNMALTTGDHMIMMKVWAKDGKELTDILANRVGKIQGVKRICPAIILERIKETI
ncbi:MAG: Lrp/AsnC family transcriptional regulator [Candidatus Hadarchaeota archaeon]|nr:Lrp/AsnC family transcriptional regulator [Candidatus Hadarchaeota archaeon]